MIAGKGFYIYQIEKAASDAQTLVTQGKDAGLGHVLIKVTDGTYDFPFPERDTDGDVEKLTADSITAFKAAGIDVGLWAFVYGSPSGKSAAEIKTFLEKEAKMFATRLKQFDCDFAVVNAENKTLSGTVYHWEANDAIVYMKALVAELKALGREKTTIAFSSYQYMSLHSNFPFDEFMQYCHVYMPQVYWVGRNPITDLQNAYQEYEAKFAGRPFVPTGAAYAEHNWAATADEVTMFLNQAQAMNLPAVNFWKWEYAYATPDIWEAIKQHPYQTQAAPDPSDITPDDDDVALIRVNGSGFYQGFYSEEGQLTQFERKDEICYYTETTRNRSTVWAQWRPQITRNGRYRIEAWVPGKHATTSHARYHIHGVVGQDSTVVIELNQNAYFDAFIPIGVFELDGSHPSAGWVNMTNYITGNEAAGKELAIGPLRWTKLGPVPEWADGFDPPIGTDEERASTELWPGAWYDVNPFTAYYELSGGKFYYHTGVDLNLPHNRDRNAPTYSIGAGEVIYAKEAPEGYKGFGNLVVIKHFPYRTTDGREIIVCSRHAHLKSINVREGDIVRRGDMVGIIGKKGTSSEHLHFDMSINGKLLEKPWDWPPQNNRDYVETNYIDPLTFIRENRPFREENDGD